MLQYKNIVGALMILSICAVVSYAQMGETPLPQIVDGQHIIVMKVKQGIPIDLEAAVLEAGGEVVSTVPEVGIAVAASDAEGFAKQLAKHEAVQVVLPQLNVQWIPKDMDFHPCSIGDDDPLYPRYQWNMPAIDAPGAWDAVCTGAGARGGRFRQRY